MGFFSVLYFVISGLVFVGRCIPTKATSGTEYIKRDLIFGYILIKKIRKTCYKWWSKSLKWDKGELGRTPRDGARLVLDRQMAESATRIRLRRPTSAPTGKNVVKNNLRCIILQIIIILYYTMVNARRWIQNYGENFSIV